MPRKIVQVRPLGECRLSLTFRGGERREIDLGRLLSFGGIFAPLREPAYFAQVSVNPDVGTIVWPNGADLCPDVLHAESRAIGSETAA